MKTILGIMLITYLVADTPRRVLLFYASQGMEKQKTQLKILDMHQRDVKERDIELQSFSYTQNNLTVWKQWQIDTSASFTFILIGRDGGEKLRSTEVVTADKLFGLIDAMPMRRNEVERRQNKKRDK